MHPIQSNNPAEKPQDRRVLRFLQDQCKAPGLLTDGANALKLTNFWTETLSGSTTEASKKMTTGGYTIKRYTGVLDLPGKIINLGDCCRGLKQRTVRSVVEFGESITGLGKSVLDGVDLANKNFGLLSKKTVEVLKPLDHFGPASAFALGAKEATFKNIPAIRENWGVRNGDAYLNMIKLTKHVALIGVGVLGMIAAIFKPIAALWVIPTLLTISVVSSVSARSYI